MPDSPRDPAAEAEKMLMEMEDCLSGSSQHLNVDSVKVLRFDLFDVLRELVERREGERKAEQLLRDVYEQIGNHATAERRHAVTPGVRDAIRDFINLRRPLPAPPAEEKPRGEKT